MGQVVGDQNIESHPEEEDIVHGGGDGISDRWT